MAVLNDTQKQIIDQLGGEQIFLTMFTGNLVWRAEKEELVFTVAPELECRVRKVGIQIDRGTDLYVVSTWDAKGDLYSEISDVYWDQLADVVEQETRLFLTINPRK
jgi:hypothetical protein